jgi:hypothetical protein
MRFNIDLSLQEVIEQCVLARRAVRATEAGRPELVPRKRRQQDADTRPVCLSALDA